MRTKFWNDTPKPSEVKADRILDWRPKAERRKMRTFFWTDAPKPSEEKAVQILTDVPKPSEEKGEPIFGQG